MRGGEGPDLFGLRAEGEAIDLTLEDGGYAGGGDGLAGGDDAGVGDGADRTGDGLRREVRGQQERGAHKQGSGH